MRKRKTHPLGDHYKDGKIVVIDFGAVKEIGTLTVNAQEQTIPSVTIGTVGYMPSEQASGQPKLSSDVYAINLPSRTFRRTQQIF